MKEVVSFFPKDFQSFVFYASSHTLVTLVGDRHVAVRRERHVERTSGP